MWLNDLKRRLAAEGQQPSPTRPLKRRHTPLVPPDAEFKVTGNDVKGCSLLQKFARHAVIQAIVTCGKPTCNNRTITVGSMCTGSAGDCVALDALQHAFQAEEINIRFTHEFDCEIDNRKRDIWCKEGHKRIQGVDDALDLPCAFADCETLGTNKAKCTMHQELGTPCSLPAHLMLRRCRMLPAATTP